MLLFRFKLGDDGKTPYERQKGKKCKQEVVPFAKKVFFIKKSRGKVKLEPKLWRRNGKMEYGSDRPGTVARC